MEASQELSYLDYLKAAFFRRYRFPMLGQMPLNQLALGAFAVLGIANPGFWLLGAAAEVAYLGILSGSRRFQKLVQGEGLLQERKSYEAQVRDALGWLPVDAQARYRRLLAQCQEILGISKTLGDITPSSLRSMQTGGLNQLLWIFLRLLTSQRVLGENVERADRQIVERRIEELEHRLVEAEEGSALERSLKGTLVIQKKRLENLDKAETSLQVVDAELQRIEQQVVLIREESAVSGKAEILSERLDSVSNALTETNRWMDQNAEIFGSLGADPLGSAPADLPEVPEAMELEG